MRAVRNGYKSIDWDLLISEPLVEAYLNSLYFMKRSDELWDAWQDIWALALYVDRTGIGDLNELPWWEYSLALEWIEGHVMDGDRFDLTFDHANRMMQRWMDFYDHLVKMGVPIDTDPISEAYRKVCGGKKLRLVERIPFTGDEQWMTLSSPDGQDVDFQISDFWLIIMYAQTGNSWDKLDQELKSAVSIRAKRKRIERLREKLVIAKCEEDPVQLVRGQVDTNDLEDAERWFFRRKTTAEYPLK